MGRNTTRHLRLPIQRPRSAITLSSVALFHFFQHNFRVQTSYLYVLGGGNVLGRRVPDSARRNAPFFSTRVFTVAGVASTFKCHSRQDGS